MDSTASTSNEGDLVIVEDLREGISPKDQSLLKSRPKSRVRKRTRVSSDSSFDDVLPDNMLEMEKCLQAAAIKNNLDDASVKKILKKVVTNDHVLALVKLREEEEMSLEEPDIRPKLTRAKAKELMKVSPKSNAPWNLENLALTPIKHIPVKTRPEVTALIAQELPDDEDDEEYKPHESDEDHTESDITFSDLDSQPRTPATPSGAPLPATPTSGRDRSPRTVRDGPFKVPQEIRTPSRPTKDEEAATIALRTRSKLSLSGTPIEHIESSFIPPDEVMPVVDDLWSQFLETCLDPTWTTRVEDDDEADPEYNVAADPDANEEDEESLESSILKISKKELNDLVTELFHIMPEDFATENEKGKDITNNGKDIQGEVINNDTVENVTLPVAHFVGKQEPLSDEEVKPNSVGANRRFSIGKTEPMDCESDPLAIDKNAGDTDKDPRVDTPRATQRDIRAALRKKITKKKKPKKQSKSLVRVQFKQSESDLRRRTTRVKVPPSLKSVLTSAPVPRVEIVRYDKPVQMLPEQVLILQQQLRQHIQLATSNFLQLYIHPEHWRLGPTYKEYLESLYKMSPTSVVHVCNLKPAVELVRSWEASVSENTAENIEMVEFIRKEIEKGRRRIQMNTIYATEFHETMTKVVANSSVFLYPFLLPQTPYRCDFIRRSDYRRSEDELVAIGLEQFFSYVKANPKIFEKNIRYGRRPDSKGLTCVVQLICKLMMPPMDQRRLMSHIQRVRKDKDNPIYKYFVHGEVTPVKHKLLPFNENITLFQQPEHELPVIWLRYVAKTSKTARVYLRRRRFVVPKPEGVDVSLDSDLKKKPLERASNNINFKTIVPKGSKIINSISFQINSIAPNLTSVPGNETPVQNGTNIPPSTTNSITETAPSTKVPNTVAKCATSVTTNGTNATSVPSNSSSVSGLFTVINTEKGAFLVPLQVQDNTSTVNSSTNPITTASVARKPKKTKEKIQNIEVDETTEPVEKERTREIVEYLPHCKCCALIRELKILRQKTILDYFKKPVSKEQKCPCKSVESPRISHRLWLLVNNYHAHYLRVWREVHIRTEEMLTKKINSDLRQPNFKLSESERIEDIALVAAFQVKLVNKLSCAKYSHYKDRMRNLFQRFNPYSDSVVCMAKTINKYFEKDFTELFKDFTAFLTAAQAEEMDCFRDYFVQNCMVNLLKKVDAEISEASLKKEISKKLIELLIDKMSSSCDIFCHLFPHFKNYPKLAEYLFLLFPHRQKMRLEKPQTKKPETEKPNENIVNNTRLSECSIDDEDRNDHTVDYEADHSSDGDDDTSREPLVMDTVLIPESEGANLDNEIKREETNCVSTIDTEELTVSKTEIPDYDSDRLQLVMSEDESIKAEPIEWSKDEDKIILQMLKDHFTSDERKDLNTVIDNLDEMDIFQVLSEEMIHRSVLEIRERVSYLLELLAIVESD